MSGIHPVLIWTCPYSCGNSPGPVPTSTHLDVSHSCGHYHNHHMSNRTTVLIKRQENGLCSETLGAWFQKTKPSPAVAPYCPCTIHRWPWRGEPRHLAFLVLQFNKPCELTGLIHWLWCLKVHTQSQTLVPRISPCL